MSTPIVTEITIRPEPVAHDTFIDDLSAAPRPVTPIGARLRGD